jgi:hypothetical protein
MHGTSIKIKKKSLGKFSWKHHFSLNIQLCVADVSLIHLQVARQQKLLLKEPKHFDLGHGCFPRISEGVKLNNLWAR